MSHRDGQQHANQANVGTSRRELILRSASGAAMAALGLGRGSLASIMALSGCAAQNAGGSMAATTPTNPAPAAGEPPLLYLMSLAEWSFHRALFAGKMDHLDFPRRAKREFGIDACEYVNTFFKEDEGNPNYIREMKKRADDEGVSSQLIMCDGEGMIGDPDLHKRIQAVQNHFKIIESAAMLGCHSIRVNAHSEGTWDEQQKLCADGLRRLTDFADTYGLNVIIENHGGLSSNGDWVVGLMRLVNHPRCGTLPDMGNFDLGDGRQYDRYVGVAQMMPFARGVSAKSYAFDDQGNETTIDYWRMMKIVVDAGYHGHLGVEYEGTKHSEDDGVRLTKALLLRIRDAMMKERASAKKT